MRRKVAGFSFIELIACLAIIALLLLIAVPVSQTTIKRKHESELRVALSEIRHAIDQYKRAADAGRVTLKIGDSGYPPSLSELTEGVVDVSSPSGQMLYFLRRVPRDPMYAGRADDASMTWGLRSYASPPDDPQPGDDVFDVYSLSADVGLNGVPYREW
ncbi:prepilin-type N-terminal cleavage/methylation domain-containing protein [Luteimonas sp. BDR2-5]|uniref:prepilin-type N-terminal cleavage/methylation domain-containing protein n=1 Tax=Proluteimonas luteida TaxID=2878685 RepID=UPI001E5B8133|nr:prepilin-type N-terminal cleavage/methylation domain-containing protein [Luteimonas sp. BDR2-5]MCD9026849.1 prepilin-type N-terminal cleavage/methylation domain-containing protein [Luteimonas sp. BDR2-5]